jgi:hypothetical protein
MLCTETSEVGLHAGGSPYQMAGTPLQYCLRAPAAVYALHDGGGRLKTTLQLQLPRMHVAIPGRGTNEGLCRHTWLL